MELPDASVLEELKEIFAHRIPFNDFLGLTFEAGDDGRLRIRFRMREEFIGNFLRGTLHGGVISTVLDTVGGLTAFVAVLSEGQGEEGVDLGRLEQVGTIDLRVDYLLPGTGEEFVATGFVLRKGRRVVVTRMELHNEKGDLIAVGTSANNVS